MYSQYIRVFKIPTNFKISYYCLANKQVRKFKAYSSMCNPKQNISRGKPVQVLSYCSNLISSTFSSNFNDRKHLGQQIPKIEPVTGENSDSTGIDQSISNQIAASKDQCNTSDNQTINETDLFENIDYDAITEGDEEKLNKFKLLMLEIDVLRQDGMFVPSKMLTDQWKELFALQTRSQRRKYLNFLFKTEMKKLADKRKKELKRLAKLEQSEEGEDEKPIKDQLHYGFRGSTIFLRIYDSTINCFDNHRLIRAMMFGQDLIIDCGYYNEMNSMENKLCCKQLVYLFAENRMAKEPFNLHFCNLNKDTELFKHLKKGIPTIEDPAFPINIYEEHYLELFPKQKLVYLTPHCRDELTKFDPNDIYIVGALVDKVNTEPLSMAKAKSEGLRMARLPLERYLDWAMGNKTLTLDQMVKILHDAQVTGDWNIAFQHIPKRKIRLPGEPNRDRRKPWLRGTCLQPPQRFKKYY